jgi:hypothetical protein
MNNSYVSREDVVLGKGLPAGMASERWLEGLVGGWIGGHTGP